MQNESQGPSGPWIYKDADGRSSLMQVVPLERDPMVDEALLAKAVVFHTEQCWIGEWPVGHDFAIEKLSRAEILNILLHAADRPAEAPES